MKDHPPTSVPSPLILAPAGQKAAFLAAIAAGAEAVYCGLKLFSARMEAGNFSVRELVRLCTLARSKGVRVYVALNSLLKPDELDKAGRLLERLTRHGCPDALIIQDLGLIELVRQVGYSGEVHLSTLAHCSLPAALPWIREKTGAASVVLPRELNVDEIKAMAAACPADLSLEAFVHGALCYGVSGRCYWSSFLGGKSSLRGRCVQPCRRRYTLKDRSQRYFSCRDLSLDVLVKVLRDIPQIRTWKIEGRKKGPHYVFYTVTAYRLLRDQGTDPTVKKNALAYLEQALGRETTHYLFLPQRPQIPVDVSSRTGSGLFLGKIQGPKGNRFLAPRIALLTGDLLRVGYEDEPGHTLIRVARAVPKHGRLHVKSPSRKPGVRPGVSHGSLFQGTPVFLIDRRERHLDGLIRQLDHDLANIPEVSPSASSFHVSLPRRYSARQPITDMIVERRPTGAAGSRQKALWLSAETLHALSKGMVRHVWWWLPPVVWPEDERRIRTLIDRVIGLKGRRFVLNAPWQMAFFRQPDTLDIWAGPFCNIANGLALAMLSTMGFSGAVVSPELGKDDYLNLLQQSPLPLGIVISGMWPLTISRTIAPDLKPQETLVSPKGEQLWIAKPDVNFWIYPNWAIDLTKYRELLKKAGYTLFVQLSEPLPRHIKLKPRPGLWNWELRLL